MTRHGAEQEEAEGGAIHHGFAVPPRVHTDAMGTGGEARGTRSRESEAGYTVRGGGLRPTNLRNTVLRKLSRPFSSDDERDTAFVDFPYAV